ncbi:hypothetical protein K469DRAFT_783913 [Zopfia rhizophila CBS 207.26]|uniref:Extracellular membrane protein CFEM domain-containing protein n=1 Tax=Zopfia rhizophila CBS 207.26 TaxID=1314779 RepID=A0A6A6DWV7_9PEZI|nr:hypothetical protein K469DRAFT_783913 [Zopfia rhizophila CBS 207.26]
MPTSTSSAFAGHLATLTTSAVPATTSLVNFDSMPECASKYCVNSTHSALPCPSISTPCPASATACAGVGVPAACYCGLPNPLYCAWTYCGWLDWMLAEDWFSTTCPYVAPVNFDPLPDCARDCLEGRLFDYGCITLQKNCFCSHVSLFGCNADCSTQENLTVANWYATVCAISSASALQVAAVETSASLVIPHSKPWDGFRWYEIFTLVVGIISVVVFLVYVFWGKDSIGRRMKQRTE